jgi:catechol 2,3-dioxygenase-like lactoylglutathione lyase family enzyme
MKAKVNLHSTIVFLKTRDLAETTRFYTQVMGFEYVLDQTTCRIFKMCSASYVGFCLTDGSTGSEEVVLTLESDDVDGYTAQLEAAGATIEVRPRYNERYQIYQMFLRDPNGYLLEVQRFMDPRWPAL